MDRATLLANSGNRTNDQGRGERVPLVGTYHPALNSLGKVARRLHPMLTNSEEHRKEHRMMFPKPPLIAFRRCKNLKDILVRARLSSEGNEGPDKKWCSCCSKSRCQVCKVISNSEHFHLNIDSREYRITLCLIVTCQMLCICWNVLFVVCNMLVAPARLLGLGLIITRSAVVSLIRGPQYPRRNSSDISLNKATGGF